jgi:TolB protein
MRVPATIVVAAAVLAAGLPTSAWAGYPGSNGKLAFERDGQIWTMNPDGSGALQLTSDPAPSTEPQWSPNGQRILYTRGGNEVRIMNADGSGDVPAVSNADSPTWAPDGSRIAWAREGSYPSGWPYDDMIWSSPEGSQTQILTRSQGEDEPTEPYGYSDSEWSPVGNVILASEKQGADWTRIAFAYGGEFLFAVGTYWTAASEPAYSPDGTQFAYLSQERDTATLELGPRQIHKINSDLETQYTPLTTDAADKSHVEWSPDGSKLVFTKGGDLWLMNSNGAAQTRIAATTATERDPDWQPVVGAPPPAAYVRPKNAGKLQVSLVPAYSACVSPNLHHGPPLAYPSCGPPVPASDEITAGTPDVNGAGAKLEGLAELQPLPGNAATTEDEADLLVKVKVTDVRCTFVCRDANQNSVGPPDDKGPLELELSLQITDRYNLPAAGGRLSATTQPITQTWSIPCGATADTTVGSTCAINTTSDALSPGMTAEGRRANIELDRIAVRDRGSNNFLRQGIFVP